MNLSTFLVLQRNRVEKVNGELDERVRRSRFSNPEHHKRVDPMMPAETYHFPYHRDTIKTGYKGLKILYE